MQRSPGPRPRLLIRRLAAAALILVTLATATLALGEGSGTIYRGTDPTRFRTHLEWRTGTYGGGDSLDFALRRRTLLKLYARQGESILLGSSGIGVGAGPDLGDVRVLIPGQVTGVIGQESIPALAGAPAQGVYSNGFSCREQRIAAGDGRGRIASNVQELAGPLPNAGGYNPCVYVAPVTGIYDVIFMGPSGFTTNDEPQVSGQINSTAADFGPQQLSSVTAWDATVRDGGGATQSGRLFAYYYAANTGGGARPLGGQAFVVTDTGFRYRIFFDGDPFGFVFYANQVGFQDSDGTPLYRNLVADPTASFQQQNELNQLQGGVALRPPTYPIFISEPDPLVLDALGIPRQPVAPAISGFTFTGPAGGSSTGVSEGGTFRMTTTQPGIYFIVVSRDGVNFDPTLPENRVLRGVATSAGPITRAWDGRDNTGQPFPEGSFSAGAIIQGGEVHFPFLDVENNLRGGPVIELINAPDTSGDSVGDCPPWNGGCFGAFYDDRGYRTSDGTLVGTAVNGNLCAGNPANPRGFGNPPLIAASDPVRGFDTRTDQRRFGFSFDANPGSVCLPNGGFGDKKGLDLWTYYPSNALLTPVDITGPTAVTLRSLTAVRTAEQVVVSWETGVEIGTRGFHILRSPTGAIEDAVRVTAALIPAQGSPSEGASYSWAYGGASDAAADERYWLEEVELSGATLRYGPVRPTPTTADDRFKIALPLVAR